MRFQIPLILTATGGLLGASALAVPACQTREVLSPAPLAPCAEGDALVPEMADDLSTVIGRAIYPPQAVPASDGRVHMVYELLVTNVRRGPIQIDGVAIYDEDEPATPIFEIEGPFIADVLTLVAGTDLETRRLGGSQTGIVYLDVTVPTMEEVPQVLTHEIRTSLVVSPDGAGGEAGAEELVEAPSLRGMRTAVRADPPLVLGPPVRGVWVAAETCCRKSHHRRGPLPFNGEPFLAQRFAIDFLKVEDGELWSGDANELDNWFTYHEEALAALDGEVVSVLDGEEDILPFATPSGLTKATITGNHVMIRGDRGHHVIYAHLSPGTLLVAVGDRVTKGQPIAKLGNSGNTNAPHLHLHVSDVNDVVQSRGLPASFESFTLLGSYPTIDDLLPGCFADQPNDDCEFLIGEVGPQNLMLLDDPLDRTAEMLLELDLVEFSDS